MINSEHPMNTPNKPAPLSVSASVKKLLIPEMAKIIAMIIFNAFIIIL